ncbi:hypothetical protein BKA59DRAFT_394867 [Fusarium tricinctum]|uniref:NB-ARC domain-containing protein n=1 Tax=Fusarium tricinctum TaxID=61284 RepID=A0A8K0WDW7_9HYPO|nr:hypothetical protein BKA59DRAFT_394867 [Fusarium tricinctum]
MLQSKIPTARILAFNYDSTWLSDAPRTRVELCGEELIQSLHRLRQESDRPIVFIAHSFGGLVVQDALLYAHREQQYRHILHHTKGFVSLGTPFRGTKVQWAADLVAITMRCAGSYHHLLSLLVYDNHQLRDKVHSLGRLRKIFSFPIFCFFELNQTQFVKIPFFSNAFKGMVSKSSSSSYLCSQLTTDHINLNKFSGPDDRSFLTVSAEVMRMCNSANSFPNNANSESTVPIQKGHWVVPLDRNEGFVGRDDILPDLLGRISPKCQENACQRTVVEGLGGIGKSQIALEAAFRLRYLDPTVSVFWVSALSAITFENAYRVIAQKLSIQLPDGESSNVLPLIKQALSNETIGKWLLIVDNADDLSLMFGPGSLESHLPSGSHGSILFTTRTSEVTNLLDVPSMKTFRIKAMSPQEAVDLMGTRLSSSQMEDVESLHALLELLCYLPLALKQAAAYMQLHRLTPKDYIHRCQSSDKGLIRLLSRGFGDRTRNDDAQHPVAKTWLISFVHLSTNSPLASQYLRFMSFLSEKNIPLSILPPQDDLEAQEAIGVLQAYGFVTATEDKEFVDMHRLVRLAIRNWLDERGETKEIYKHVQLRLILVCLLMKKENRSDWARYIPHCYSVANEDALSMSVSATWHLLTSFSNTLSLMGLRKAAFDLCRQAERVGMAIIDLKSTDQIALMLHHAWSLMDFGHFDKAEEILQEVLSRHESVIGKHQSLTIRTKGGLAMLLRMRGQHRESEQMTLEVLQVSESALGKEDEQTLLLTILHYFSLVSLGRYEEVEKMARQSLERLQGTLGEQHKITLQMMNILASSLGKLQQFHEAKELSQKAVRISKLVLGEEDPMTLQFIESLARILCESKQFLQAEELSREAFEAQERIFGKENSETLVSADTLACALSGLGRFLEAEEIHRDNLQACQRLYGEEHPDMIVLAISLGSCLRKAGKHQEAVEVLRQTVQTSCRVLGEDHTNTASCLRELLLIPREFWPDTLQVEIWSVSLITIRRLY